MNRQEAYRHVSDALQRYRNLGFGELSRRVGTAASEDLHGETGARYILEVVVAWATSERRALEVRAQTVEWNSFRFDSLEERIRVDDPDVATSLTFSLSDEVD